MKILHKWSVAKRYARHALSWGSGFPIHVAQSRGEALSLPRRLSEQFLLQLNNAITAKNYYDLGLFDTSMPWREKRQYLGHYDVFQLFKYLNSPSYEALSRDKIVFHLLCEALGIESVAPLAVYACRHASLPWPCLKTSHELELFLRRSDSEDLFFKTEAGSKGRGALSIGKRIAPDTWLGLPDEKPVTLARIVEFLEEEQSAGGWIVQRRVRPHSAVADVVPHVCPTIRIMTLLDGDDIHVTGALIRFGDGTTPADNGGSGGVVFLIDLSSGQLTKGAYVVNGRTRFCASHPSTGVEIQGRVLPFWEETLTLAVDAACNFPSCCYLGWDIVLTEEGPAILETNSQSGLLSLQKLNRQGLLDTPLRKIIAPHEGVVNSGVTLFSGEAERGCGKTTERATSVKNYSAMRRRAEFAAPPENGAPGEAASEATR